MSIVWITKRTNGRGGGAYKEYYSQPVVITTPNGEILATPCVMEMLGNPTAVKIGIENSTTILFQASSNLNEDFKVQYVRGGKDRTTPLPLKSQMARISANQLTKHNGMISDSACFVWTVSDHGDYIGLDIRQKRGVIPYNKRTNGKGK